MTKRFLNKTVVITGASSGIGAAAARQFANEGARVVLAARRKQALEAVASSIGSDNSLIVTTDVTDLKSAAALLEKARERFGAINVLINNAGYHARGLVEDRRLDELVQMIDVNIRAPVALCRLALPYLRQAGGGAIVNVASLAGRVPVPGAATYSATKFGLRAFSLSLAEELRGSGITISVVSPGLVDTEFFTAEIDNVPPIVFSQPMSSAKDVAAIILDCAYDGRCERTIPRLSGGITTLGYILPRIRRMLRPLLELQGKRNKERYLKRKRPKVKLDKNRNDKVHS
jgi:hypothetical protein